MGKFLKTVFITAIIVVVAAAFFASNQFSYPNKLAEPKTIVIDKGTSGNAIAERLTSEGVIRNAFFFKLYLKLTSADRDIKAGEYEFAPHQNIKDVVMLLSSGDTVKRSFTIPEGWTSTAIVAHINQLEGLGGEIVVIPAEGSLLPETYYYSFGDTRKDLIDRMQEGMEENLAQLWGRRDPNSPIATLGQAMVLASIVEKETGVASERGIVASVFLNRLRLGMPLQSDPTVIYALTNGEKELERPLYFKDLEIDNPYNTYKVRGLPPTPICNPGLDAIQAVFNPAKTDYLYFVADGTGGHVFARTLDEHNTNVAKWRALQKEGKKDAKAAGTVAVPPESAPAVVTPVAPAVSPEAVAPVVVPGAVSPENPPKTENSQPR